MNNLRIHYLQHVNFEGLGCIETWVKESNHSLSSTKLYHNSNFPPIEEIDWLIIMGGPMGVNDEEKYPWLSAEKEFILKAIKANKTVIGICLGAQLIASILGAKVYPNTKKEIGWFPIHLTPSGQNHPLMKNFPEELKTYHWHGDTFELPAGSTHLIQTDICPHQAFIYKDNVIGFQFHLEVTEQTLSAMLENGKHELIKDDYIQSEKEMLQNSSLCANSNQFLVEILNQLAKNKR